jgi:hypothetical protein
MTEFKRGDIATLILSVRVEDFTPQGYIYVSYLNPADPEGYPLGLVALPDQLRRPTDPSPIQLRPMSEAPRNGRLLLLKVRSDIPYYSLNGHLLICEYYPPHIGGLPWKSVAPLGLSFSEESIAGWAELEVIDPSGDA